MGKYKSIQAAFDAEASIPALRKKWQEPEAPFGEGIPVLRCMVCRRLVRHVSSGDDGKCVCDDCKTKQARKRWNRDCKKINRHINAK